MSTSHHSLLAPARIRRIRRVAVTAIAGGLLVAGLAACSDDEPETGTDPAEESAATPETALAGAAWLEGQLVDGVLYNEQYEVDDYSSTVEAAYALMEVDPDSDALKGIGSALAEGVDEYTSPGEDVYAGSLAKLVSFATDSGADPHDFGGEDLVAQLEDRTADDGPAAGRISDVSAYGDYANSFGQAWAVRGLTNAESDEAVAALDFLLLQQCEAGYFRLDFSAPEAKDQSCDGADEEEPPVDTAALVVVLLHDLGGSDPELATALDEAVSWIVEQQAEDGSFEGGSGTAGANSNSTGLAGWALQAFGEVEAAADAASWVRAHQVESDCSGKLADAAGAIAFDDGALDAAADKGITVKTSYQWRLSTVQALPALLAVPEGAEGAPCPSGT